MIFPFDDFPMGVRFGMFDHNDVHLCTHTPENETKTSKRATHKIRPEPA